MDALRRTTLDSTLFGSGWYLGLPVNWLATVQTSAKGDYLLRHTWQASGTRRRFLGGGCVVFESFSGSASSFIALSE